MRKLQVLNAAAHIGCCICALLTMQCACIVAEYPELWAESLALTVLFGSLTAWLYQYAERIDYTLHMTRLEILQAAQKKRARRSGNCGQAQKAAN